MRCRPITTFLLLTTCLGAQELVLDGRKLTEPAVLFDPLGAWQFSGDEAGQRFRIAVAFEPYAWPRQGKHELRGNTSLSVTRLAAAGSGQKLTDGSLELATSSGERLRGTLSWITGAPPVEHRLAFDLAPAMRRIDPPRVLDQKPAPAFTAPADRPNKEDIVFCAFGNPGTGLPGQRSIAEQVARLAPSGPLDFVVLLGDLLLPKGTRSLKDELFRERFERVYDQQKLAVPFYCLLGDRDHLGEIQAPIEYGDLSRRWTMPNACYSWSVSGHGQTIDCYAIDTLLIGGDIGDARNRVAVRLFTHALDQSRADWRIVFGHEPLQSHAVGFDDKRLGKLHERVEPWLQRKSVDLYVAGGPAALELLAPKDGTLRVLSGGGGGPEVAESVHWRDDTLFAATGGGFTWFRFDGKGIEISFRDCEGRVLFAHRLDKQVDKRQ
jgi:hypothetical protein